MHSYTVAFCNQKNSELGVDGNPWIQGSLGEGDLKAAKNNCNLFIPEC